MKHYEEEYLKYNKLAQRLLVKACEVDTKEMWDKYNQVNKIAAEYEYQLDLLEELEQRKKDWLKPIKTLFKSIGIIIFILFMISLA